MSWNVIVTTWQKEAILQFTAGMNGSTSNQVTTVHALKYLYDKKRIRMPFSNFNIDNSFETRKQYLPREYANSFENLIYAAMFASVGCALAQLNSVCATLYLILFTKNVQCARQENRAAVRSVN